MSYEYTVSIPADKRTTFRAMVKMMGGSMSRARKIDVNHTPNAATLAAIHEAQSSKELETFDFDKFRKKVASL